MIRPCCGTPADSRHPSPHAAGCRAVPPAVPSGGPYCIAARCPLPALHAYAAPGCSGDPFAISPIGTIRGDAAVWPEVSLFVSDPLTVHRGHTLPLTGAWYCDDCDSPYCNLA